MTDTQEQTATTTGRQIKVVSTRGGHKTIDFTGTKWSELKRELEMTHGYNLGNMKCVESITRRTLEHPEATIPEGNFNLFLMPVKSKSGADRKELYAQIKALIEEHGDVAKSHFTYQGNNHTRISTDKLDELMKDWNEEHGTSPKVEKQQEKKKERAGNSATAIGDVVESVKSAKEGEKVTALYQEVRNMSTADQMFLIIKLLTDIHEATVGKSVTKAEQGGSSTTTFPSKSPEEIERENKEREEKERLRKEKEEKERKEREEREALEREMADLGEGFNDVDKSSLRKRY